MISTKDYIKINKCVDGGLYSIEARNGVFGYWNSSSESFTLRRCKFGSIFLFDEYHWDIGAPYGTVKPIAYLNEERPATDTEAIIRLSELTEERFKRK